MPSNIFDRVCETSTTTGTGNFTLAGAIAGYRTFDSTIGINLSFYYLIEAVDGSGVATGEWEIGLGAMTSATVMQRLQALESSTDSAVSFAAGTKRVHMTAPAYQIGTVARRASLVSALTSQDYTTAAAIPWNASTFDSTTAGVINLPWHNTSTNNTRFTIPTGFDDAYIRLTGQVTLANITASEWVELKFRVDGGATIIGRNTCASPSTSPTYQVVSQIHGLNAGQYVEMMIQVQSDTSIDISNTGSFFQLELIQ